MKRLFSKGFHGIPFSCLLAAIAVFLALASPGSPKGRPQSTESSAAPSLGQFEAQTDVGQTLPGSTVYIPDRGIDVMTGAGAHA